MMAIFVALDFVGSDFSWLRRLETTVLDLRLELRGQIPPGAETVILMIDDKTLADEGRWPLPRAKFARVIDNLRRAGAKVIVFDILFIEPEVSIPDDTLAFFESSAKRLTEHGLGDIADEARRMRDGGDAAFAHAIREAGNVVLPFTYSFDDDKTGATPPAVAKSAYSSLRADGPPPSLSVKPTGIIAPIPLLATAAAGLGHALVAFDVDGAPRYDYPVIDYDLGYYPSLPVRIVQLYLGVPWDTVTVKFGEGVALGPVWAPTDPSMRSLVNYRGRSGTYPTFSFSRALAGTIPDEMLRDRIVLIGTNIVGIKDTFRTPFTSVLPGVERLATLVDSTLHGDTLRRSTSGPYIEAGLLFLAALMMGICISRLNIISASAIAFAMFVGFAIGGHVALVHYGLWFMAAVPTIGMFVVFTVVVLYRFVILDREHRRTRTAFARYLAPNMVERLSLSREPLALGGELRELTLLFCDVRNFSSLSEKLQPQQLTRLVNDFFTPMTEVILAQGGTVDKYIGDGIMAFWNAPISDPGHAEHACRAALGMIDALNSLNEHWQRTQAGIGPIEIGIGINTGSCTVGNFGSKHRFDYSALGDAVNVAARLEGETKSYRLPIIIGPETAKRSPMLATLPVDYIRVRGRAKPIEVFGLVGNEATLRDPAFIKLHQTHLYLRAALLAKDWDVAEKMLHHLTNTAPKNVVHLYSSFIERVEHFRAHPPPSDWDGSFLVERRHETAEILAFKTAG